MTVNSQGSTSRCVGNRRLLACPSASPPRPTPRKLLDGPFGDVLAQRFAKVGMVPLGYWDNGIRNISNSKRAIVAPGGPQG